MRWHSRPDPEPVWHTFGSYSKTGRTYLETLKRDFKMFGNGLWIHAESSKLTSHWKPEIEQKLKTCRAMLILISEPTLGREQENEWKTFCALKKPIICISLISHDELELHTSAFPKDFLKQNILRVSDPLSRSEFMQIFVGLWYAVHAPWNLSNGHDIFVILKKFMFGVFIFGLMVLPNQLGLPLKTLPKQGGHPNESTARNPPAAVQIPPPPEKSKPTSTSETGGKESGNVKANKPARSSIQDPPSKGSNPTRSSTVVISDGLEQGIPLNPNTAVREHGRHD